MPGTHTTPALWCVKSVRQSMQGLMAAQKPGQLLSSQWHCGLARPAAIFNIYFGSHGPHLHSSPAGLKDRRLMSQQGPLLQSPTGGGVNGGLCIWQCNNITAMSGGAKAVKSCGGDMVVTEAGPLLRCDVMVGTSGSLPHTHPQKHILALGLNHHHRLSAMLF